MKLLTKYTLVLICLSFISPVYADEANEPVSNPGEWRESLKQKYSMTDEQIGKLKDSGISYPNIAKMGVLAEKSGKSLDEISQMRLVDKKGWGVIVKELGVPANELGQSVSSLRKGLKQGKTEKRQQKTEKREARASKRAEKRLAKSERRMLKSERRNERRREHKQERRKGR